MAIYYINGEYHEFKIPPTDINKVKIAIASNSESKALLSLLCDDDVIGTVGLPLGNPNIDKEDIERIYKKFKNQGTSTFMALLNIANNPNTPDDILKDIFNSFKKGDSSIQVLMALATNPSTPPEVLEKIFDFEIEHENKHYILGKAIIEHHRAFYISLYDKLLDKALVDANLAVALINNEYCIINSVEALYTHKNANVRYAVAKSRYCNRNILLTLAEDSSIKVKRAVAANPSSCALVLDKLVDNNDDYEILLNVLMNPNCVEPIYNKIIK